MTGRKNAWLFFGLAVLPSLVGFLLVAYLLAPRGFLFEDDDPLAYYIYLRSAIHDRDLDFTNEYEYFRNRGAKLDFSLHRLHPITGRADNQFTAGTAVVSAPIYLLTTKLLQTYYPRDSSLRSFPWFLDQMIFSCALFSIGFAGLWFAFRFCASFFDERAGLAATLLFWACSPLLYYFIREPFQSHLASVFSVSAILYVWRVPAIPLRWRIFVLGTMTGIAAMVRLQDALVMLVPAGVALLERPTVRLVITRTTLFFSGFFATFWIQMLIWFTLRGSFFSYPYTGYSFEYWMNPRIFQVLFSSNHGLLVWHPIITICLAGLVLWRENVGYLALICFVGELYIIASWWDWFGGYAFGNRAFLGLTPFFVLGLAWIFTHARGIIRISIHSIALLFLLWNIVLAFAYLSGIIPHAGEFSWVELIQDISELRGKVIESIQKL